MSVSWVVSWAGRLIQAVSGRSRIFGAWVVPKRCGCRARASVSTRAPVGGFVGGQPEVHVGGCV